MRNLLGKFGCGAERNWGMPILLLLGIACATARAASPLAVDVRAPVGELEIRFKDQKLLVYAFATNQFKPYVRELYTLTGENVLRDAPPDHLHHHGLMYAVYVHGTNFWEERGEAGFEKPAKRLTYNKGKSREGLPRAEFSQSIYWVAAQNREANSAAAAVLVERRTISLTVNEQDQEVALRWDSSFEVGRKAAKVTVHGPNYDGLGLRLPESFNHVAHFENSADQPYTGNNTQNVIPAKWTTVSGKMADREIMLALFGHPTNARGYASFFSMLDPFAYLSATQELDKKPLEYSRGERFRLRYLLTVYSEKKPRAIVEHRCESWTKE